MSCVAPEVQPLEARRLCSRMSIAPVVMSEVGIEGARGAVFVVALDVPSDRDTVVRLRTRNGSAKAGMDYVPRAQSVTLPAGATSVEFPVAIIYDTLAEPDERFFLDAAASGGARNRASAPAVIVDEDRDIPIQVAASLPRRGPDLPYAPPEEPARGRTTTTVQILVSHLSVRPTTVRYRTVAETATPGKDYVAVHGVARFTKSEVFQVRIPILADRLAEPTETFRFEIFAATGGAVIEVPRVAIRIIDPPLPE